MQVMMIQIENIVVLTETTVKLNTLNISQMQFVLQLNKQNMLIVKKKINVHN